MQVIMCVDNEFGMMFNNRRQSRDRAVIEDIINTIDAKLWIREYSKTLFVEYCKNCQIEYSEQDNIIKMDVKDKSIEIIIEDDMVNKNEKGDYCFCEDVLFSEFNKRIDRVILYMWNKKYPADMYTDINILDYNKVQETEFRGYSHDKITKIVYERI